MPKEFGAQTIEILQEQYFCDYSCQVSKFTYTSLSARLVTYPRTYPDTSSEISEMIHILWRHFASSHDRCELSDVLHAVPIYNSSSYEIKFPLDPSLWTDKRMFVYKNQCINKMSSYRLKQCRTFWDWRPNQEKKTLGGHVIINSPVFLIINDNILTPSSAKIGAVKLIWNKYL